MAVTVRTNYSLTLDEAEAGPEFLLEDDFTGSDGAPPDTAKWFTRLLFGTGSVTIESNRLRTVGDTGGSNPVAISQASVSDFEWTVRAVYSTLTSRTPEFYYRTGRSIMDGTMGDGYVLQLSSGSGGTATLYTYSVYSSIAAVGDTALNGASVDMWFKFRIVGDNHKIRWWADGAGEPGTWQIDATHSTWGGGHLGVGQFSTAPTDWDDVTVEDLGPEPPLAARWHSLGASRHLGVTGLASSDATFCSWFRVRTGGTTDGAMFGVDDGSANYYTVGLSSTTIRVARTSGGDYNTGFTPTADVWYFLSVNYVTGTGVTTVRVTPEGGSTTTFTSGAGSGPGNHNLWFPGNGYGGTWDNDFANLKVWAADLDGGELATEMAHARAQRTSNLVAEYSYYDGIPAIIQADLSGNGHHLETQASRAVPYPITGPAIDL